MEPDLPGVFGFVEKATCVGHVYSDGFRVALFISLCYDEDVFRATAFPFPVSSCGYREGELSYVCERGLSSSWSVTQVGSVVVLTTPKWKCEDSRPQVANPLWPCLSYGPLEVVTAWIVLDSRILRRRSASLAQGILCFMCKGFSFFDGKAI